MRSYRMSTRRKLAIATWSAPREGNIYGKITVNVTNTLRYIQFLKEKNGEKVTITHIVGNAIGKALKSAIDINGRILFGKYIPHDSADVSFLVALNDGNDLGKVKVSNIDQKTTIEISRELKAEAERVRHGKDEQFEKSKPLLRLFPTWMIRPILWGTGFITGALGWNLKLLGIEKYPFGACIVTSVGMLGIDEGYAPPTPFARVPIYIAVMSIKDRVAAQDGQVVIRPEVDLMVTIDHRFMDGYQGAKLAHVIRKMVENPWTLDGHQEGSSTPFDT